MITTGIDIVKIDRITAMCSRYGCKWWLRYVGTNSEWENAHKKKNFSETLAGTFATKEAYIKAVSSQIEKPALKDVEILHTPEGRPYISSNRSDIHSNQFEISISHEREYAIAIVLYFYG